MSPEIIITDQGTDEWLKLRLGVVTGSNVSRALAKKGTETRNSYLMELVGQIATRQYDEIFGKALDHGRENEVAARAAYEFQTGNTVEQVGFVYGQDRRVGFSPDGLTPPKKKFQEFKCPATSRVHADFLCNDKVKSEYQYQIQWGLWILDYETCDFGSYHPCFGANTLKVRTFEKDPKTFERFENEIPEFLKDLDGALKKINVEWGSQWL